MLKATLDTKLTPELIRKGLASEVRHLVQNARKKAGLKVDDRIYLKLEGDSELREAINEYRHTIYSETLTEGELNGDAKYTQECLANGHPLRIGIQVCG